MNVLHWGMYTALTPASARNVRLTTALLYRYNVCLDLECISSRCQHCAYMRHRGSLLVTKLGRRIVDPRLWYIQPNEPAADWPYVEDKLKLLPLQASYVQGYQQACQDRESQRAQAA